MLNYCIGFICLCGGQISHSRWEWESFALAKKLRMKKMYNSFLFNLEPQSIDPTLLIQHVSFASVIFTARSSQKRSTFKFQWWSWSDTFRYREFAPRLVPWTESLIQLVQTEGLVSGDIFVAACGSGRSFFSFLAFLAALCHRSLLIFFAWSFFYLSW